jgi:hypothetical protein
VRVDWDNWGFRSFEDQMNVCENVMTVEACEYADVKPVKRAERERETGMWALSLLVRGSRRSLTTPTQSQHRQALDGGQTASTRAIGCIGPFATKQRRSLSDEGETRSGGTPVMSQSEASHANGSRRIRFFDFSPCAV